MAQQKFTNNATSKLAGSLTNVATSLSVTATEGAKFPSLGAGEWFMVNLVKLVGGLPVIEIVKVTARATDTFTIVRAQESTLATTFSAGDVVDLRITAGTMDNTAQRGGDNTYTGSNDFTGVTTLATVAGADNSNKAVYSGWVRSYAAAKGANNDITSLSGLTTALSVAQGGTGATAGPQACLNLGAVQQGTGVGQSNNAVKIGWATTTGGLKATVDSTDQGFIPFVSSNPSSGSDIIFNGPRSLQIGNGTDAAILGYTGSGAITRLRIGGIGATGGVIQRFDRATGDYTIGYGNTGSEVNRINMDSGGAVTLFGGALASLSNSGFLQIGASGGLNVVYDYGQIQARNNGAVSTLSLNFTGGLVQAGPGGFSTSGTITGGTVVSDGVVQAKANSTLKYYMYDGATIRGYVGASSTQCFIVTNAANTIQALYADNSGNITAAGNITANSDESLKKNWRDLPGFLDELAGVTLVGAYERIDTGEIQIGMSAQQVRAFAPELVVAHPDTGLLSLNYGSLGAVAAVKLAQRVKHQQQEINELKILVKHLIEKVGGA